MDDYSPVLLTKFVLICVLFLLCQLGTGSKYRSSAQISDTYDPLLPSSEVDALSNVISKSGLASQPFISRSFCDDQPSLISITINCSIDNLDGDWHITEIIMENVYLSGVIHADVAQLTRLRTLDLSNNQLYGSIPFNLGNLSHLIMLDLSNNQLTGSIPPSLGNLKNLLTLGLGLNFLHGTIPPSLGNLSSLEELNLWSNRLSGVIPRELGGLSQLQRLTLDDNELNGTLPPELGKLSNLLVVWLESNKLTGELPQEYEQLMNLLVFAVAGNYLAGPIRPFIANWVNLTSLHLLGNNFEGELPLEIFSMTKLNYLMVSDLRNNGFYFPNSANLKNIDTLILRNCNIIGEIPSYIGDWSASLNYLDLSFNRLNGGIPHSFQRLNLSEMSLTRNMLSGKIPEWLNETVTLSGDLSENNFTFEGPRKMNRDFPYNASKYAKFSDQTIINTEPANRTTLYEIRDEHCHGKKSKDHSLFINAGGEETSIEGNRYDADNTMSNTLYVSPANRWAYICSGYFLTTTTTNVSDYIKSISCGVSVADAPLYAKARLCPQSLTYYGFCLHKGNYNVKLHFAEIIFSEDEDHSSSGKRVFDVYIQGNQVLRDFNVKEKAGGPNKVWTENFTANVGDDHLLEIRLFWAGKGSIYNKPALNGPLISAIAVTPNFKVRGLSAMEIVGIVIVVVLVLFLLLVFMWRMGWIGDRELRVTYINIGDKSYTLKQVKDSTGNFSSKNEIGKGRLGTVYKAQLPDQNIVAVKKLSLQSNFEKIGTEVYALIGKKLKHENLVELLAVVTTKSDLNLMIYEYMEKGSLDQALFGNSKSEVQLDWETRVNICLEVAKGLKRIHEDDFIHRNVKACNVFLDGNLNAKVSDLGLAKLYEEENPYWFIQEIGTSVYMAPEYATRQAVTDKVDVYGYGILLLEIVSGKSDSTSKHEQNQETVYLLDTACVLHKAGRPLDLVDEKLSNYDRQQAIKIFDLAMMCINQSPILRPTMSEVVSELDQIMFPGVNNPSA